MQLPTHEQILREVRELAKQENITFSTVLEAAYHTYKHVPQLLQRFSKLLASCSSNGYEVSRFLGAVAADQPELHPGKWY